MRKSKQTAVRSDIYALIRQARMSELDRHVAISAMQKAEAFVDSMLWVKEKLAAVGNYVLRPSFKH